MRSRMLARLGIIIALLIAISPTSGTGTIAAQAGGNGLLDDTSYESPQFGYTVSWDDTWSARPQDVTSNDGGFDAITIRNDTGRLRISGRDGDYAAVDFLQDTVDLITSNADSMDIVSENLDGDTPTIELTADRDHVVVEARTLPENGAVVVLTLTAPENDFESALAAARERVVLNDEPVLTGGGASPVTPDAEATPRATAESTSEATNEGITDDVYTSPTYGYSLTWDADVWEAESRTGADGYNELRLGSPSATVYIWSGPYYAGDAAACVQGESDYYETADPAVSDWKPAADAEGNPIAGQTSTASYGVFTLTYTDPETEDAEPVSLVDYIECRPLVDGESVLVIFATTTPERYNRVIEDVLDITNGIELAGEQGTPEPVTAATPGSVPGEDATLDSATPDAQIPETAPPVDGTSEPTAESRTGLDGSTFTSLSFGFSLDIPSAWTVDDEAITERDERLVLNNGTSIVTLEATSAYNGDLEGCVTFAQEQLADDPAFTDLTLDVTSTGDPFQGSNAESAYANFTYTGPGNTTYAHFISCRSIVEGESFLILSQDVPYDSYATQRQSRRQIEDAIDVP